MTRQEALVLLRRYQREEIEDPRELQGRLRGNARFDKAVYETYLVSYLRNAILSSKESPLEVVSSVYQWLDDCLAESRDDKPLIWWNFAAITEHCAGEILRYMRAVGEEV